MKVQAFNPMFKGVGQSRSIMVVALTYPVANLFSALIEAEGVQHIQARFYATMTHIKKASELCAMKPTRNSHNGPTRVDNNNAYEDDLAVKIRPKTKKPPMYRVLLLNDDFTPMDFVVYILERVFGRTREEATEIMLAVHHKGVGTAGVYTYEIAETKVDQVMMLARQHEHPLQCTMEREN
jgi:ATP-dependent Clp protease adaptor protein ClpS